MFGCGEDSTLIHAQAAISAGIATSTATNPIWLVKTRLQLDKAQASTGNRRYKNSLDCIRQVLRQEGLGGLYKGLSASYLGAAETALHLVLYERLKGILQRSLVSPDGTDTPTQREINNWIITTGAAGSAKFAAALIAYPHEVRNKNNTYSSGSAWELASSHFLRQHFLTTVPFATGNPYPAPPGSSRKRPPEIHRSGAMLSTHR